MRDRTDDDTEPFCSFDSRRKRLRGKGRGKEGRKKKKFTWLLTGGGGGDVFVIVAGIVVVEDVVIEDVIVENVVVVDVVIIVCRTLIHHLSILYLPFSLDSMRSHPGGRHSLAMG